MFSSCLSRSLPVVFAIATFLGFSVACTSDSPAPPEESRDAISSTDTVAPPVDARADLDPAPRPDAAPVPDAAPGPDAVFDHDTAGEIDEGDATPEPQFGRSAHRREEYPLVEGPLQAGVGVGYFEVPVGVSMAGFGGRVDGINSTWSGLLKGSQGLHGWPIFKALAFEAEGEQVVFVKTPMMSSATAVTEGAAAKLDELYGLDLRGRIITGAGHSHHTVARYWRMPDLLAIAGVDTPDEEVLDRITTALAETVKSALDDLGPAEWGYATQEGFDPDDEIYGHRREEVQHLYGKDDRLVVLGVRRPDGRPLAAMVNFPVHGTGFGSRNDLLSEDVPGAIEMQFEEYFFSTEEQPVVALFMQSGAGDAAPRGGVKYPIPQRIERIGLLAAQSAVELYRSIEWRSEAEVGVRSRRLDLHYDWIYPEGYDDFSDESGTPYYWGGWQCRGKGVEEGESMSGHPKVCSAFESLLALMRVPIPFSEVHQVYLSTARLGPLFFMSLPGEPNNSIIRYMIHEFAARIAERGLEESGAFDVMGIGYSQDHALYLSTAEDWFMGGYEAEMSFFGPLGSSYLVDRQMELAEDLLDGYARPVFYNESRDLSTPGEFTPRALEVSVNLGSVIQDVATDYERTEHVHFHWVGGDPSIAPPRVRVQYSTDSGFVDVPHPAGWPGEAYDNTRHHILTRYTPDPPASGQIRAERQHAWLIDWQVPHDFPAGTYRLVATGSYWDGAEVRPYEVVSREFGIRQATGAALSAELHDSELHLRLTLPPVEFAQEKDRRWPTAGWRLFDATVAPQEPQNVRVPLLISLSTDTLPAAEEHLVTFDHAAGAYLFNLAQAGLEEYAGAITVDAHVAADHVPSPIQTTVGHR